jgi:hypothetical protein
VSAICLHSAGLPRPSAYTQRVSGESTGSLRLETAKWRESGGSVAKDTSVVVPRVELGVAAVGAVAGVVMLAGVGVPAGVVVLAEVGAPAGVVVFAEVGAVAGIVVVVAVGEPASVVVLVAVVDPAGVVPVPRVAGFAVPGLVAFGAPLTGLAAPGLAELETPAAIGGGVSSGSARRTSFTPLSANNVPSSATTKAMIHTASSDYGPPAQGASMQ